MTVQNAGTDCRVYRAKRQPDLYVYLRNDLEPTDLPETLRARTGPLIEVMPLRIHAERKLARVDVQSVISALLQTGWFIQLPPGGLVHAALHFGD